MMRMGIGYFKRITFIDAIRPSYGSQENFTTEVLD